MHQSRIIQSLIALYGKDSAWVTANSLLINLARQHELVVGGSIAMAITRKKVVKIPGDIDLFTNSADDAWSFLTAVKSYLQKKPGTFYQIGINNKTKFVLEGVDHHFRLTTPPFWLNVCIMVLKEPIRKFYHEGLAVQYFDDVVVAAKKTTVRDGKVRVPFDPFETNPCGECRMSGPLLVKPHSFDEEGSWNSLCSEIDRRAPDPRVNYSALT